MLHFPGWLANLALLLLATAWLTYDPGFGSGIAFVTSLSALVVNEVLRRRPNTIDPDHIGHDRVLFERYESTLSEERLRHEINSNIYNLQSSTGFTYPLWDFIELGKRTEGKFLLPDVQAAFQLALERLEALARFILIHFFVPESGVVIGPDNSSPLSLYPEAKHEEHYERRATELRQLLDDVDDSYTLFRDAARRSLAV